MKISRMRNMCLGSVCLILACTTPTQVSNSRVREVGCSSGPCQFVDVTICGWTSPVSCNWMDLEVLALTSETLTGHREGRDCFVFTFRRAAGRAVCGAVERTSRPVQVRIGEREQELQAPEGNVVLELIPSLPPTNVVRLIY